MKLKYKIIFVMTVLLFLFPNLFPSSVKANNINTNEKNKEITFYVYNENNFLLPITISYEDDFSESEKIYFLLENVLNYDENVLKYIPEKTKIRWVSANDENVQVSFSDDIKKYGGCYYEKAMLYQILKTIFSIQEVKSITIYINDKIDYFTEGSIIYNFSREDYLKNYYGQDYFCN